MGSNPCGQLRIVARIRSDFKKEGETFHGLKDSKPWISILRPDPFSNPGSRPSTVKISFGSDQASSGKQRFELDDCYEQEVCTKEIFTKEIKPLISGLFRGQNSTIFAYGPRESGKTYTIQGCEEELGLAVLTVDAILPQAEEQGKIVTVSVFEVYQDRVSDLLGAKSPEVAVFEDAQGKIRLKGLSKVKVNSTSEFQSLYLHAANACKQLQKTTETLHRSHIGCIVHVVSPQTEKSKAQLVGKINFIDLASYEDSRRMSTDGSNFAEAATTNKSLYAVHNVLYALNAKEARVPYRESKLTRMLQDSLGGTSKIVMVTCMNPSLCQETVQTISLASRSCMADFLACLDPGKSSRSATKTIGMTSPQILKSASKFNMRSSMMSPKVVKPMSALDPGKSSRSATKTIGMTSPQILKSASKFNMRSSMMSPKVVKPMSASALGKKQTGSKLHMSMKKKPIEANERKLLNDANQLKKSDMVNLSVASEVASNSSTQQEEQSAFSALDMDSSKLPFEEGKSNTYSATDSSRLPSEEDVLPIANSIVPATPFTFQTPTGGNFLIEDKETQSSLLNIEASPPLSARIKELSDNLKSISFSTEASLKMAQESSKLFDHVIHKNLEPETPKYLKRIGADDKHVIHENSEFKTPIAEPSAQTNGNYELANLASPWESFHMRSSGMKDSLVQEYLKFLNTASKDELKGLKGIGEKRATYIIEKREESPEPFKQLDDLQDIGLSAKQIKGMMKQVAVELFT